MIETKKGKYTDEENELIIQSINKGLKEGKKEREVLKELSEQLKRGYAGIMSHVRKLRSEYPDRFHSHENSADGSSRLNSWEEAEEEIVIETVNQFLEEGKSLSAAIAELEKKLSRTQGAIYQRIYTLRRKHPEKFTHLPTQRPRRRRKFQDWQVHRSMIRPLEEPFSYQADPEELSSAAENQLATASDHLSAFNNTYASNMWSGENESITREEAMIFKAFEERYGRPNPDTRGKLIHLMRTYGCTRVSIALFTLSEDKAFPTIITDFLEQRLQNHKFF
ncbi:hypothetical protein ACFO25_08460 [Paenactinomyces guangxiensis]|uniref:Uncharacterized protein n=1 Tax=Paenactinomyces guangxiensis TaxID=1490290 RepID=A0A7W1WN14_9BACL|nr:hypothetical protein [Paenactinomyces guangxiensis]MBA4492923.1 hypothetical protein [Paenactinomyces guangxiensis]MBH8590228.1 hypothetical protein [Paenactinomyces guangxiensis]